MLHIMRLLELTGLKVKKPMILEYDNREAINICNNWIVNRKTKHINTRYYFLRELKEKDIIESRWIAGSKNSTDLFTKNSANPYFTKHVSYYYTDEDFLVSK